MSEARTERRREKRMRSLLGGHVVMNNKYSTVDCLVRNITDRGARLHFGDTPYLPQEFELRIDGRNDKRRVRKIWSRDGEMGVEFD
ncbi:PilZ domain-containing protein [Pinisolibacter sp.]|uniref:PilZ domain-containing protein n=1 Tax=Pinisolibacter sp. TaxID=2172024 RepID=UPI002FDEB9CA